MTEQKQVALVEYNREIGPMIRTIEKKKQIIKDFKETDEKAVAMIENVKVSQAELKAYVEAENADVIKEIKELETELKEAVKAAARSTKDTAQPFTAGDLKPYFSARAKPVDMGKPKPVKKVIDKGETFVKLETLVGTDD